MKRNFIGGNRGFSANDELEVPLRCPFTKQRMMIPARSNQCQHIPCFDLEPYLMLNSEKNVFRCHLCGVPAVVDNLEVDEFIWNILRSLSNPASQHIDHVLIDVNGRWRQHIPQMKVEEGKKSFIPLLKLSD